MSASFKVNIEGLRKLQMKFDDPAVKAELKQLPQKKAVAAIVGQAIANNFEQEGPGWAPLKAKTIRQTIAKKLRKNLSDMTDRQILKHETHARRKNSKESPYRKILQKTGLLKKLATTPGASGTTSGKHSISGSNIYKTQGTHLVWGVNLIYAGAQNNGSPEKGIPARPFLVVRDVWKKELYSYIAQEAIKIVKKVLG